MFGSTLTAVATTVVCLCPSPLIYGTKTFIVNFSTTNNVLRLNISIVSRFFPGDGTGIADVCVVVNKLTGFIVPLVANCLSGVNLRCVVILSFAFTLLTLVATVVIFVHCCHIFVVPRGSIQFNRHGFDAQLGAVGRENWEDWL